MLAAIHFRLMVWNTNTGQLEFSTPEHNPDRLASSYRAMELHRDECVAVTEDGRLDHWKWTGQELIKVRPSLVLKTTEAERLACIRRVTASSSATQSGSIQALDLKAGRTVFVDRSIHNSEICGAIWCNANRPSHSSRDGKLALWQYQRDASNESGTLNEGGNIE